MGQKDIISKTILKRIFIDVATYIFNLKLNSVELIETEHQRIEDRRADLSAKVVDHTGQKFILHIEIQNDNKSNMPIRMLRYFTDICFQYPGETVYQYLLYIGKASLSMPSYLKNAHLDYQYRIIDMHEMDYQFFMQQNTADALVLAILANFKKADAKTVVHEVLTKLINITQDDKQSLREYVSMLEILATNRDINLNIQQELEMLEIELEKLPSYLIGEKHGVQKGEKIGEQRGLQKGEKIGEQRGLQKGRLDSALAIAKQLLSFNLSLEEISKITGIALPDLERFKKEKNDSPST